MSPLPIFLLCAGYSQYNLFDYLIFSDSNLKCIAKHNYRAGHDSLQPPYFIAQALQVASLQMALNAFTSAMRNPPLKWHVAHGAIPFLKSVKSEKQKQLDRLFLSQPAEPTEAGRELLLVGHLHSGQDLQKCLCPECLWG